MSEESKTTWERLCRQLSALGWKDHFEGGVSGLLSPNDAIFLGPEQLNDERRLQFTESLARHISSMEEHNADDEALSLALLDLRQLRHQLSRLSD